MVKRADLPVLDVLQAIQQYKAESTASIDAGGGVRAVMLDLSRLTPTPDIPARFPQFPYKIVLARLEQLGRQGLIDWGVVITRPWLTDKGRALLTRRTGPAGP